MGECGDMREEYSKLYSAMWSKSRVAGFGDRGTSI